VTPPFPGEPVQLTPVVGDVAGGLQAFEATVDVGVEVRCLAIVKPGADGWTETCRTADEAEAGTNLLAVIDGAVHHVEWTAELTRIVELDADAPDLPEGTIDALWSNGCLDPVQDVLAPIGPALPLGSQEMIGAIACEGDLASASFGSVFLQPGPVDGGLVQLERDPAGAWTVVDTGTGIEPEPRPLPVPPSDELLIRRGPLDLPPTDITERLRQDIGETATVDELLDRLVTAFGQEPEFAPLVTVPDQVGLPLAIVQLVYPDDAVGSGTAAVWWTQANDGGYVIDRAFLMDRCSRGQTELDGRPVCV
jgi:hypothetical protein